jgi:hypothetical protein
MNDNYEPALRNDFQAAIEETSGRLIKQMRDMEANLVRAFQDQERLVNALPFLTPAQFFTELRLLALESRVRILELETRRRN